MRQKRILAAVFGLSVVVAITLIFCIYVNSGGFQLNLFPAVQQGQEVNLPLTFLASCIVGGALGSFIGFLSTSFLLIMNAKKDSVSAPMLPSIIYSISVGAISVVLLLTMIWNSSQTYEEFTTELTYAWSGLLTAFIVVVAIAAMPLFTSKKYFDI